MLQHPALLQKGQDKKDTSGMGSVANCNQGMCHRTICVQNKLNQMRHWDIQNMAKGHTIMKNTHNNI